MMFYEKLLIKFKDPENQDHKSQVTESFARYLPALTANDATGDLETFEQVNIILDAIFNTIIVIAMFLCFFSLSSSMGANMFE